jgi:hypothetical protein
VSGEMASQSCFICCEASSTSPLDYALLCYLQDPVGQLSHADTDVVSPSLKLIFLVLRVLPYFW